MSTQSYVSLIDLSKQFQFEIDEDMKKKICFNETLIVSCGHYEGEFQDESTDSECSRIDSTESKLSDEKKDDEIEQTQDEPAEELPKSPSEPEENDFHFYFFPDCNKPVPARDSLVSCVTIDGFPKVNPNLLKGIQQCTCGVDKSGDCPCYFKVPCRCGAKKHADCTCQQVENICICDEGKPQIVCKCKPENVCLCYDDKPRPVCVCNEVDKPCICQSGKYPCPICVCDGKPNIKSNIYKDVIETEENGEGENVNEEEESVTTTIPKESCTCQKLLPKPICYCRKGKECLCKEGECSCGVPPSCICEPTESAQILCKEDDSKTVCVCPVEKVCTCNAKSPDDCECFPKPVDCTCGYPEDCVCTHKCDCVPPCLCDLLPKKEDVCVCDENRTEIAGGLLCTCPPKKKEVAKLKRMRAGKHDYRWCPDVDPRHNYFGYAYDKHDKISYKEQEKEKLKILGLYSEPIPQEGPCPVHGSQSTVKQPEFKKKVRRPSLDCCSAVGGISISVETLGEDKDKFLVQVVSHASKEGAKTGSKLVSILDCNLHTLEENKTEHITKKDLTKEQRSYMTICEKGYYNKVTRICGERHYVKRLYHSFDDARNFLLEGANVVLLRYIGISRYCGHIKTDTVLIDGTICESIYVSLGVSQAIVNGKPLFVVKVERHIIEPSGFIHQTLTVLTLRGYMVSHEWADTSYIFHINPLLQIVPEKDEIEPHEPLREHWRSDLQLFSDYLDHKSTRSSEGAKYVTENGELTGLIRDYLQTLLLLRPHDALQFTRNYFGSTLSALDLPHDEYFEPCTRHVRYYFFEE
ncbi:uncharacterized protein LOC123869362 isoform X1 [Maniola jurtina]|uniref:uncharacterized protein LOC123869362 isoform X1 n=1 Tax=Maniola jurtina TaxID=191418 RepID=UPI001E68FBCB|nr:uncharacterized protein LOC123869362 isoform X1 [Maniola jurtina]